MRIEGMNSTGSFTKLHRTVEENKLQKENLRDENKLSIDKGKKVNRQENREISEEEIINAIEKANEEFVVYDKKFEFSIHEGTKEIMVKVIDATTDEVIREIPPEKILDMVAKMWELAGILVDEKV